MSSPSLSSRFHLKIIILWHNQVESFFKAQARTLEWKEGKEKLGFN